MTEHQRNQDLKPGEWSRARRSTVGGGTIPYEWQAQCIDLDALLVEIDGMPHLIGVAGRLWAEWDKIPFRVLALIETKHPGEQKGAYVTFQIARDAGYSAYCVTLYEDRLVAERNDGEVREFASVRDFIHAAHVLRR